LNIILKYKNLNLEYPESLIDKLAKIGNKSHPNEVGGFLIGQYSEDFKSLKITDFIVPKKYTSTPISFIRNIEGLLGLFKRFFTKGLYYVGEWHTHPNGSSEYSSTDLRAMINCAECSTVSIENPVLLILGVSKDSLIEHTFYHLKNKALYKYG